MSYALRIQAARARVKAALIDLIIATDDNGVNGIFDAASASIGIDHDGDVHGLYSIDRVLPSGDVLPVSGGSL